MKIVLDTDKKTITVPWNYTAKLEEIKTRLTASVIKEISKLQ